MPFLLMSRGITFAPLSYQIDDSLLCASMTHIALLYIWKILSAHSHDTS